MRSHPSFSAIRFVAISDTHTKHRRLRIPECDVLLHAGDITFQGEHVVVADLNRWAEETLPSTTQCVLIAGNHDLCFEDDKEFALSLIPNWTYLEDSGTEIGGVRIWGSPWTPRFHDWAFNLDRGILLKQTWEKIPEETDLLLCHGPPYGLGDFVPKDGRNTGCVDLLERLKVVRPQVVVCGHIHEGRGGVPARPRARVRHGRDSDSERLDDGRDLPSHQRPCGVRGHSVQPTQRTTATVTVTIHPPPGVPETSTVKHAACVAVPGDNGRILVVETHKNGFTTLGLPGGKIESGETPAEAAARELFEETGLRVVPACLDLLWVEDEFVSPRSGSRIVCSAFLATNFAYQISRTDWGAFQAHTTSEGTARVGTWQELINPKTSIYHEYNRNVLLALLARQMTFRSSQTYWQPRYR